MWSISILASKDSERTLRIRLILPNQVRHYDDMFSVCRISTLGGSVWSISILASKDSEKADLYKSLRRFF